MLYEVITERIDDVFTPHLPAQLLEQGGWLAPAAWIYIEAERTLEPPLPPGWTVRRSKEAGQVGYRLVRRPGAVPAKGGA